MQLRNHDEIIQAITDLQEVRVAFRSKEDGGAILSRRCAPMDYGPSRNARNKTPRYHFWDFESDSGRTHTLSLLASQITSVEVLDSSFDPASFVSWKAPWFVVRTTWGNFN
jgi:hypothetical protein